MGKSVTFEYDGKEYTLEFNRRVVERMERQGFVAEDVVKYPMTALPTLFNGAFQMHHKGISKDKTDEILSRIHDTQGLIGKLAEMYNEPILTLVGDEDDNEKNVTWEASW